MDNANVTINEKKGRVFSTGADASHFVNCKGLIKIKNSASELLTILQNQNDLTIAERT